MNEEFVGVSKDAHITHAIRAAFAGPKFDICCINKLPEFDYWRFAQWIQKMHCEPWVSDSQKWAAQCYTVNYFLCPDAPDEFEVEALARQIFQSAPVVADVVNGKRVFKIGKYELWKVKK